MFLNEATNDEKLHDLIWGLIGVDMAAGSFGPIRTKRRSLSSSVCPACSLRNDVLLATAVTGALADADPNAKPEPEVFYLLMSGQTDAIQRCIHRNALRLKSFGLLVNGYNNRRQAGRPIGVVSQANPNACLLQCYFRFQTTISNEPPILSFVPPKRRSNPCPSISKPSKKSLVF